jgi:alanine dehydrogenase
MPGAYARTSTFALNNVTTRYGLELANKGVERACQENSALMRGLNLYQGTLTCEPVAETFNLRDVFQPASELLGNRRE